MTNPLSALVTLCVFYLIIILFATLYPLNFFSENGVHWIAEQTGLYFDEQGRAYTDSDFMAGASTAAEAVSVELWLKERNDSKNWGPREIFSFYDGSASPSLLIGEWSWQIFIYSRFEDYDEQKWYLSFRPDKGFSRYKTHFVTVTFDEREKALYIDGELIEKRKTLPGATSYDGFSGRLLLGNTPMGSRGWMGEIQGLAVYGRILSSQEVARHYDISRQGGMRSLVGASGLRALYPFDEGSGNRAADIVNDPLFIDIPEKYAPFQETFFHYPGDNMRIRSGWIKDFILNIFFFVPLGSLIMLIVFLRGIRLPVTGSAVTIIMACGLLSLSIEITQLYMPDRFASIMDVISNMLGAGFGIMIVLLAKKF